MRRFIFFIMLLASFSSCQKIETGDSLSKKQIQFIRNLGLLDNDEKIIKFYSEYKKKVAGNFFTNKRMANYWIDESDKYKTTKESAFYPEIIRIDTNYMRGAATFTPYLEIMKKDSSRFRLSVDGKEKNVRLFFEEAIATWKKERGN